MEALPSIRFEPLTRPGPLPEALEQLFESGVSTFAILDGAQIANLPELLDQSGLPFASLFDGDAERNFGEMGPWLVKLDRNARFTAQLFTIGDAPWFLWDRARFVLLRSELPLDRIKQHFKRFVRPETDGSKRLLFRFWDAQILADYVDGLQDLAPDRADRLFADKTGWVCEQLGLCVASNPEIRRFAPKGSPPPFAPFVFDATDRKVLQKGVETRLVRDVGLRLAPAFDAVVPGGSGFAKDHARGAFTFLRRHTPDQRPVYEEDCFQLALLGYLLGREKNTVLNGPLMTEHLISVSHRVALLRESYFAALRTIATEKGN